MYVNFLLFDRLTLISLRSQLRNRRLDSIRPEEAAKIYASFMEDYRSRGKNAAPHRIMVDWPSHDEFSRNFLPHPAQDGYQDGYASSSQTSLRLSSPIFYERPLTSGETGMGVDMAIDVGGPACRVFYQPAEGNLVRPNLTMGQPLALYSRSNRSPPAADDKWEILSQQQEEPYIELPDGTPFYLLPRVVLPRHIPQTPQVVNVYSTLPNISLFMPNKPYEVTRSKLLLSPLIRYRAD